MTNAFTISTAVRRPLVGLAATALAIAALTGCSSEPAEKQQDGQHQQHEQGVITITDPWTKATAEDAKPGEAMTGVFGELENHGDKDLVITGVTSEVAGIVELHEVVDGVMREIQGDVTIPAGGSLLLEPGANHIMLMDITKPLLPGDDVDITLSLSDGSTMTFTALVKDTSGANESYGDLDHGDMDHGDMDHGDMKHGSEHGEG